MLDLGSLTLIIVGWLTGFFPLWVAIIFLIIWTLYADKLRAMSNNLDRYMDEKAGYTYLTEGDIKTINKLAKGQRR